MQYNFCVYTSKKERVDMYMSALFTDISRSYIQKLIENGCIKINGKIVKKNLKIDSGDEISIEEIITSIDIIPENIPLDIIYEDENICVINKDVGINVHPTPGIEGKSGTLVNALLYHCKEKLPVISGEERPGIVHRLDKNTSGVIITAKNDTYMKLLSEKIKKREVEKYYIAIVVGIFPEEKFTIHSDIGRDPHQSIKMTTRNPINPKNAITHGEILGYVGEDATIMRVQIETGRTHQIRVHLASIGYPILGDFVYGEREKDIKISKKYNIFRQMLHSYEYKIEIYNQHKSFIAHCKGDMQQLLEKANIQL